MKTLHYRRHSLRDGEFIGALGLELARTEGEKVDLGHTPASSDGPDAMQGTRRFARVFHGPLIRTAQTAFAFTQGLGYFPTVMPTIPEIGTAERMAEIGTQEFRDAHKANNGNALAATREVFGDDMAKAWARVALDGVSLMFEFMEEDEVAIAFGHSPIIDLAIWALDDFSERSTDIRLAELEGVVLVKNEDGSVDTLRKISVAR